MQRVTNQCPQIKLWYIWLGRVKYEYCKDEDWSVGPTLNEGPSPTVLRKITSDTCRWLEYDVVFSPQKALPWLVSSTVLSLCVPCGLSRKLGANPSTIWFAIWNVKVLISLLPGWSLSKELLVTVLLCCCAAVLLYCRVAVLLCLFCVWITPFLESNGSVSVDEVRVAKDSDLGKTYTMFNNCYTMAHSAVARLCLKRPSYTWQKCISWCMSTQLCSSRDVLANAPSTAFGIHDQVEGTGSIIIH